MINKLNSDALYWKRYNKDKEKLIKKIINFNNKSEINYLENEHYNHTRDLFALSLAFLSNKKKRINILDYGSNLLTLCNLNNKINTKRFNFFIFDPFEKKVVNKIAIKDLKYKILNNEESIIINKYELLYFGSSIQYEENFLKKLKNFDLKFTKIILFTHTPFSLDKSYSSTQSNHLNLIQYIHSLNEIIALLKKKKFNLIFRSRNDDKYIACKKTKSKTYSLNLIFKK
jgi:hypothetical protein